MPNVSVPAAAAGLPTINRKPDLDEISGDIGNLAHLIDELVSKILDVDHSDIISKSAKLTLNRAGALCWIARDIVDHIEANFWNAVRADRAEKPVPAETGSLEKLIERHSYAHKMFNDTCDRADTMSENFDQAYVEINKRFDEEEEQALKDIAAFRTSTRAEEEMKAAYLLNHSGHTYDQDSFVLRAMLTMMAGTGTREG